MNEKFTQGKWITDIRIGCIAIYAGDKVNCISEIDEDSKIAYWSGTFKNFAWHTDQTDRANAKLMGKASEMYYLLKSISDLQKECYGNGSKLHLAMIDKVEEIDSLLKQARGEE